VVPTIVWGGENTFDFCFDGIERGCIVAVSTIGMADNQRKFMIGFNKMCEVIKPEAVLNYGQTFDDMERLARIITIPYKHGSCKDDS
jgi:hypothetical protein